MMVITKELQLNTQGNCDVQDITPQVEEAVRDSGLGAGIVTVFCPGSTGGLTTIEFESGVVHDLCQVLDEVAPPDRDYRHHLRWHDDNGHSHVRATTVGPSLALPVVNGAVPLGTWQQIVFMDFDTRPRKRTVHMSVVGV